MARWFRMYAEVLHDPKVQQLSPKLFKVWTNLLCLASANDGQLGTISDVSFQLRMKPSTTKEAVSHLIEVGLIDNKNNELRPHNWDIRQFKSDSSTERVKRFRNVARNESETPSDTDTDTDTEQIQRKENNKKKRDAVLGKPKPASVISFDDWFQQIIKTNPAYQAIDCDRERQKMEAWLTTHPGRKLTKKFAINWLNKIDPGVAVSVRNGFDPKVQRMREAVKTTLERLEDD